MISLNFTDAFVYAVDCNVRGGEVQVSRFVQVPMPENAIRNGVVSDASAVREALEPALRAQGFGKLRDVAITAVSAQASNNEYVLPYTRKASELETMLRAEVVQALSGGDYVFDYTMENVFQDEETQKCRMNVYVLPQAMVDGYAKLLGDMGVKRRGFDAEKNCILRFSEFFSADFTGSVLAYADEKLATLIMPCNTGSTIMRRYPLNMADQDAALEEFALQIVKIAQFKQISQPGSAVHAVYLFGNAVTPRTVREVGEVTGFPTALLGAPGRLHAPQGFEFFRYVFAVAACLPAMKVGMPSAQKAPRGKQGGADSSKAFKLSFRKAKEE